jgi:hypothetical protein
VRSAGKLGGEMVYLYLSLRDEIWAGVDLKGRQSVRDFILSQLIR